MGTKERRFWSRGLSNHLAFVSRTPEDSVIRQVTASEVSKGFPTYRFEQREICNLLETPKRMAESAHEYSWLLRCFCESIISPVLGFGGHEQISSEKKGKRFSRRSPSCSLDRRHESSDDLETSINSSPPKCCRSGRQNFIFSRQ